MPELPEVEVARRGIDEPLRDARIRSVRLGKPLRWPLGREPADLVGATIGPVQRRGKYLWIPLGRDGSPAGGLLLHLGMSGSLALLQDPPPPGPHDHFEIATDRGTLRLTDPRRFGAVLWSPALDSGPAAVRIAGLGPEPFDERLDAAVLHAGLQQRRAPIKAVLLAGDLVVGAGNIYACEALFEAGIDPRKRADRISRPRAARLLQALRAVLARALQAGGSTLRDFHAADGRAGAFQSESAVYGRAGQPCPRCGGTVRRIVQAQRSTFFCPACQKR